MGLVFTAGLFLVLWYMAGLSFLEGKGFMTRHSFPFMLVSDQTPSLIDVTAGFRL